MPQSLMESMPINNEESVMANFDFLACENGDEPFVDNDDNGQGECRNDEQVNISKQKVKVTDTDDMSGDIDEVMADAETEDALAEFDFLVSDRDRLGREPNNRNNPDLSDNGNISPNEEWKVDQQLMSKMNDQYKERRQDGRAGGPSRTADRPSRSALKAMLVNLDNDMDAPALQSGLHSPPHHSDVASFGDDVQHKGLIGLLGDENGLEGSLGLGELADLNVNNEGDSPINDVLDGADFHRKAWAVKYTLRSHFDAIRAVVFHPVEPALITAGEDHVIKLWNLQKSVPGKKTSSVDLEPVYTFRAHTGPVLSLAVIANGKMCYSGGTDGAICLWNLPNSNTEVYDSYDASVLHSRITGHSNAVWGLTINGYKMLSCSADGTVKLWDTENNTGLLNTFSLENESGVPTSVDFMRSDPDHMVVSYSTSKAYIFDMENSKPVVTLDSPSTTGTGQINRVITHPTLPLTVTAHDDRHIRFFDNNTGKVVHSMVAHLDAITSLALDPSGLYLLSGSHDCSVRLWNLETKTCIQEITAHRKKFDESIHDVAFHPSKPFIASVGADGVAKVFV